MRASAALTAACLLAASLAPGAARAQDASPPAREWASYCRGYLKALEGDSSASDLDVTYCVGVTQGLLNGMRVGSQLGALGMASQIALKYQLDPDAVFKLFTEQAPERLLGICTPPGASTRDHVQAVLEHLERKAGDLARPISEVLYEALQARHPCG